MEIDLPLSTANVSGPYAGSIRDGLMIWREDKSLMAAIVPTNEGTFAIRALPPGKYHAGSVLSYLYGTAALAEFDLAEGEARTLDLDLLAPTQCRVGYLLVQVVDENGTTREDAQVRLDGPLGLIEPLQSAQGTYAFIATPGPQVLQVTAPGCVPATRPVTLTGAEMGDVTPQTILVRLEPR
jgi:hypothetical protein